MADSRFYDNRGPFSLAQVESLTGALAMAGTSLVEVQDVAPLDRADGHHASYCDGVKFQPALRACRAGAVFVSEALAKFAPPGCVALVCRQPALAFAKLATALYPKVGYFWPAGREPLRLIADSVRVGADTVVAPGAFLGENVEIGSGCIIGSCAVIGRGVRIGRGTSIGAHASISHALVGDRCIVHAGARIGQDGFGFVGTTEGHYKIPQLGRVIIQDDVEIGANVTIDRGALADTIIGEGTKIDNLVQIGHNTRIGRRCIIVSQVGISGSCDIGDFVVIGGQTGVADHVNIGQGAYVAAKSGVSRSLEGGKVYGGFPARPIEQWRREVGVVSRLAKGKQGKNERSGSQD